jgi:hypothetical protein
MGKGDQVRWYQARLIEIDVRSIPQPNSIQRDFSFGTNLDIRELHIDVG